MKKVSPLLWSLGIGSAVALFLIKPVRKTINDKKNNWLRKPISRNNDGIHYV